MDTTNSGQRLVLIDGRNAYWMDGGVLMEAAVDKNGNILAETGAPFPFDRAPDVFDRFDTVAQILDAFDGIASAMLAGNKGRR